MQTNTRQSLDDAYIQDDDWDRIGKAVRKSAEPNRFFPVRLFLEDENGRKVESNYTVRVDNFDNLALADGREAIPWEEAKQVLPPVLGIDFNAIHANVQQAFLRDAAKERDRLADARQAMSFWKDQFFSFSRLQTKTYEDLLMRRVQISEAQARLQMQAQQDALENTLQTQQHFHQLREADLRQTYQHEKNRMQLDHARQQLAEERNRVEALKKELDTKEANLKRQEGQLLKNQEKVASERAALEERIQRSQKELDERLAEQQRLAAQRQGNTTPRAKLEAERKALELEKSTVAQKMQFAEDMAALNMKERTEIVEARAAINLERAEMAKQREALMKEMQTLSDQEGKEFYTPREHPPRPSFPKVVTPLRMPPAKEQRKRVHFVGSGSDDDSDSDSSLESEDPLKEVLAEQKRRVPSYGKTAKTLSATTDDEDDDSETGDWVPQDIKWHTVESWVPHLTRKNAPVFLLQLKGKYVTGEAAADDLTERLWMQVHRWVLAVAEGKCTSTHMLDIGQECLNQLRLRVQKVREPTTDVRAVQRFVDAEADPSDKMLAAFHKVKPLTKGSGRFGKGKSSFRTRSTGSRSRSSSPGDADRTTTERAAALYCTHCRRYGHSSSRCFQKKGRRGGSK